MAPLSLLAMIAIAFMKGGKRFMKNKNDILKLAQLGGMVLMLASTLVSSWVSEKMMHQYIEKEVSKQLENKE